MLKFLQTSGILLILASTAYAQSNSVVFTQMGVAQTGSITQVGNSLSATVSQNQKIGTNRGNEAKILQRSDVGSLISDHQTAQITQDDGSSYNKASITQLNRNNKATISQSSNSGGPTAAEGNVGFILQNGYGQTAMINQNNQSSKNTALIEQTSYPALGVNNQLSTISQNDHSIENTVETRQYSDGNVTNVIETTQSNKSTSNAIKVNQGVTGFITGSQAIIEQNGDGTLESRNNQLSVIQDGRNQRITTNQNAGQEGDSHDNYIFVSQTKGNGQVSSIYQNFESYNNSASVKQEGDSHVSIIYQAGVAYNNQILLTQTGYANSAGIEQIGQANNNSVIINQSGSHEIASVEQQVNTAHNEAKINQTSGANTAVIYQVRDNFYNKASINQSGIGNDLAEIDQFKSDHNTARITQGDYSEGGNWANGIQINAGADGKKGNTITINQNLHKSGGNNFGVIIQGAIYPIDLVNNLEGVTSSNNIATLNQEGSYNTSNLYQVGDDNVATISQLGNGNKVKGTLKGGPNQNEEFSTQFGTGNSLVINQTSALGGVIDSNTANVFQQGTANRITINQTNQ